MRYKNELLITCFISTLISTGVIVGWVFDSAVLKLELSHYINMKFNTAFSLLLASVILCLSIKDDSKKLKLTLILILLGLNLLSIAQNIFSVDLGIDELFVKDESWRLSNKPFPGRMSGITSFSFILISLSFLIMKGPTLRLAGQFMLHLVSLLSLIVIIGYVLNAPQFYTMSFLTAMALPTAITLFFYTIGASLLNPTLGLTGFFLGNHLGNVIGRILFPSAVLAMLIITMLRSILHQRGLVDVEFGNALFAVASILIGLILIWTTGVQINRIDERRSQAERDLKRTNENLESIILERTADLQTAINKLKESETKLTKSELLFKGMFDYSDSVIFIKDLDGKYISANSQIKKYFNISVEELRGKTMHDFLTPEEIEKTEAIESAILNGGESYVYQMSTQTALGKRIFQTDKFALRDEHNVIYALATILTDVTELKNAEASINAIFNTAMVSIISTNRDGIVTNFNKGAERLLGYKAEEVIGTLNVTALHVAEEMETRIKEEQEGETLNQFDVLVGNAKNGKYESKAWTYVRQDGSTFPVQLITAGILDEFGNTMGYLGIATDVTDLKKAKIDLEILANQLQRKNNQLVNFNRVISHNLRSPIVNLATILNFYKTTTDQAKKEVYIEKFEAIVKQMTGIFSEFVDILKIQEDTTKDKELLSLEDALKKSKIMLAGAILEAHAQISHDFTALPEILYPKSYLESIFLNLLSNAIKYRSPGRDPIIHCRAYTSKGQMILTVKDNGLGIDMKKYGSFLFGLNHTFHGHPEAKGVGLYITKTQVEAMGGSIMAESEVNVGTTFTIVFNKKEQQAAPALN